MFAIGDKQWPGISKLVEECGEVLQVCGKLMAAHGKRRHWDGTDLANRLVEELGDLHAALEFVLGFLTPTQLHRVTKRSAAKLRLFQRWHRESLGKEAA